MLKTSKKARKDKPKASSSDEISWDPNRRYDQTKGKYYYEGRNADGKKVKKYVKDDDVPQSGAAPAGDARTPRGVVIEDITVPMGGMSMEDTAYGYDNDLDEEQEAGYTGYIDQPTEFDQSSIPNPSSPQYQFSSLNPNLSHGNDLPQEHLSMFRGGEGALNEGSPVSPNEIPLQGYAEPHGRTGVFQGQTPGWNTEAGLAADHPAPSALSDSEDEDEAEIEDADYDEPYGQHAPGDQTSQVHPLDKRKGKGTGKGKGKALENDLGGQDIERQPAFISSSSNYEFETEASAPSFINASSVNIQPGMFVDDSHVHFAGVAPPGPDDGYEPLVAEIMQQSRDDYSREQAHHGGGEASTAYGAIQDLEQPEELLPSQANVLRGRPVREDEDVELDPRYKVQPSVKFQPGQVFKVLWFEPKGSGLPAKGRSTGGGAASILSETKTYIDEHRMDYYAGFRRFIVIANDDGHSTCVPILTYERKACLKKGVKPKKHGIVYQEGTKPKRLKGEPELGFSPVCLRMMAANEPLAIESRINYSKLVTIEHNIKVLFIGHIIDNHWRIVADAVDACWEQKRRAPDRGRKR